MKFFYDTEFIQYWQKPLFKQKRFCLDIISIGITKEDGTQYYAINKDLDYKMAWNTWQQRTGEGDRNNTEPKHYWLRENVLKQLFNCKQFHFYDQSKITTLKQLMRLVKRFGKTREQIANDILNFCGDSPELWGYYSDYDHVCMAQVFGDLQDYPAKWPMYTLDIKHIMPPAVTVNLPSNHSPEEILRQYHQIGVSIVNPRPRREIIPYAGVHNAQEEATWLWYQAKKLNLI